MIKIVTDIKEIFVNCDEMHVYIDKSCNEIHVLTKSWNFNKLLNYDDDFFTNTFTDVV